MTTFPVVAETEQDQRRRAVEDLERSLDAYRKVLDVPAHQEYREHFHFIIFDNYMNCLVAGMTKEELREVGKRYDFDFTGGMNKAA